MEQVPEHSVPILADVRTFDWAELCASAQFDVIMMDPPWQLASANPTRGVALGYSQLSDKQIGELPVPALQTHGFLFLWTINVKYRVSLELFEKWGYRYYPSLGLLVCCFPAQPTLGPSCRAPGALCCFPLFELAETPPVSSWCTNDG